LIIAIVQIAVLFAVGWLLRRKTTMNESGLMVGAILLDQQIKSHSAGRRGECDLCLHLLLLLSWVRRGALFRGYIQSRLNAAWGRPYQFFGVNWGWGIVIMSLLFGLMHFINLGSLAMGNWQLEPWWGFWTIFAGLVLGFVPRENRQYCRIDYFARASGRAIPCLFRSLTEGTRSVFECVVALLLPAAPQSRSQTVFLSEAMLPQLLLML